MYIPRTTRFLRCFCLALITCGLCLIMSPRQSLKSAAAYGNDAAAWVQQGVDAYRDYRYQEAINFWADALATYSADNTNRDRAIILENLARAYQQLGHPTLALESWQAATAIYTALTDWSQVGRTLTEQAQTYSRLGQPFQAIGLLCAGNPESAPVLANDQAGAPEDIGSAACVQDSAVNLAQRSEDLDAQVAALGSLGEAYRSVQNYLAALKVLAEGQAIAVAMGNPHDQALLHNSLGNTYREQAELNYQRAAASRRSASGNDDIFEQAATEAGQTAQQHFSNSRTIAQTENYPVLEIKALLGLMLLQYHVEDEEDRTVSLSLRNQAIPLLEYLPPNQAQAYLALQLTKQKLPLAVSAMARGESNTEESTSEESSLYVASRSQCRDITLDAQSWSLLEKAQAIAEDLGNNRLSAFTRGEIGHFYECSGKYPEALAWTESARLAASDDQVLALDTLYLWQWQMGRIYSHLGQVNQSIQAYAAAVEQLNLVRDEILASNQNLQFDFRDAVAPVYRELAAIQLSLVPPISTTTSASQQGQGLNSGTKSNDDASEANITGALGNIDNLQLAELQNYFGSDCLVPVANVRLDQTLGQSSRGSNQSANAAATALISTIIFPEQTAVILTLPGQGSQLHWIQISEAQLRQQVIAFRNALEDTSNDLEAFDTQPAQALYQELIAAFKPELDRRNIKTLVFVHDGILRNIPMAALHDGEQYLVEQYAVAIAPSLQQIATDAVDPAALRALILGLSEPSFVDGSDLGALPAVWQEVAAIQDHMPDSVALMNKELTKETLKATLTHRSFQLMHIATHGKFGTDPENTFLVLGDKEIGADGQALENNQRLRLGELDTLIRDGAPREGLLELIVLSACQTASGDERSSLGLAGVTIRAGAKSALASLWSVDDGATAELITDFYGNWVTDMTKVEALQAAQISILKNPNNDQRPNTWKHPAYWSAFVLVGDWR